METAVWPVANAWHESMLDRVEMDICDMSHEVLLVANDMLPVAPLPEPPPAPFAPCSRSAATPVEPVIHSPHGPPMTPRSVPTMTTDEKAEAFLH